ncbi:MAG: LCP family protein [Aggregatilineales bacterium]
MNEDTQPAVHLPSDAILNSEPTVTRAYIPSPLPKDGLPPPLAVKVPIAPPRRTARKSSFRGSLYVLIAFSAFGLAIAFMLVVFGIRRAAQAGNAVPTSLTAALGAITATPLATGSPTPSPTPGLAIQPWDGKQRFTVLLMGIDKRPGESGTAFRTDTLIVMSLDPATHTAGMLSVPRDLFISIPPNTVVGTGYGLQRINAAYAIGELVKPGSGPQLEMQTVQYNLGMRINAYVVVDFQAVVAIVNAVGGIDVDVPYTINDPAYPNMNDGYDPLYIPAGHVHMDGDLALKYARSRHQTDDLDRAKRQQQIIQTIRSKILGLNMAPQLLAQSPTLWSELSADVHTDLTLDQLLQLAVYAKDIPIGSIRQAVIDWSYVKSQVYQGMDILVPDRALIGPLLTQTFGANYNG